MPPRSTPTNSPPQTASCSWEAFAGAGGGQTFRFATNRPDLSAAFVFYGPPPDKVAMARITASVYGFYAGNDARIDATLPDTTIQMKAASKTFEPVVFNGAGHGFMRASEAPDANDANKKAPQRCMGALEGSLGKIILPAARR
jgi:carboxymethylenebutenolidase